MEGDEAFEVLPDIGLHRMAAKVMWLWLWKLLEAAGFDIPVVGMVKDDKHRTRALIYRKNLSRKDPAEAALQKEEPGV